jgi:hypothetical protein
MAYYSKELIDLSMLGAMVSTASGNTPKEGVKAAQKMEELKTSQANQQLKNQKLALETLKLQKTLMGSTEPAVREYSTTEQQMDSLVPESFGLWDSVQVAAAKMGSPLGIESEESLGAFAAKQELNKTILEVGASAFTGRPSKFLLQLIQDTLPTGGMQGDSLAYQKYRKIKDTFLSTVPKLQNLIDSAEKNKDVLKYKAKLADVNYMVNRLDNVLGSFENQGLGENEFYEAPDLEAGQFSQDDIKQLEGIFRT